MPSSLRRSVTAQPSCRLGQDYAPDAWVLGEPDGEFFRLLDPLTRCATVSSTPRCGSSAAASRCDGPGGCRSGGKGELVGLSADRAVRGGRRRLPDVGGCRGGGLALRLAFRLWSEEFDVFEGDLEYLRRSVPRGKRSRSTSREQTSV